MGNIPSLPTSLLEYCRLYPLGRCYPLLRYQRPVSFRNAYSTEAHPPAVTAPEGVRLRFGPSPTGFLHLGGFRTALFNYLLAKSLGGQFLLRIEDTDRTRLVEGAQEALIETLRWAGIDYDEGPDIGGPHEPYIQSQRLHIYSKHTNTLLQQTKAYRCFCSTERLDESRLKFKAQGSSQSYDKHCRYVSTAESEERAEKGDPFVVRLKNEDQPTHFDDLVYGNIGPAQPKHRLHAVPKPVMEDYILIKSDGMPTYHFANVVDDHEMRISHVLRGEEWIASTPKHLALYNAFGWKPPLFAHLPILVSASGKKLSKRDGDVHISAYKDAGWEPEALLNTVALLGASWENSVDAKGQKLGDFMSLQQMVRNFSIDRISRHRSTLFAGKLAFLNKQHLLAKTETEEGLASTEKRVTRLLKDRFPGSQLLDDSAAVKRLIKVMRVYVSNWNELPNLKQIASILDMPDYKTEAAAEMIKDYNIDQYARLLSELQIVLSAPNNKDRDISELLSSLRADCGYDDDRDKKRFMTTLRHALTARKSGISIHELMEILQPDRVIERLERAKEYAAQRQRAEM